MPVRSPLTKRAEDLVRLVKEMKDEPAPRAVHELRTTIRRVETLLFAEEEPPAGVERKLRKQLDRIRKRAGKVRDVDVHLKALRSLPKSLEDQARDSLRLDLRKDRDKRQKRLVRVVGDERDRSLVKRLRRVVGRAAPATHGPVAPEHALAAVLADFNAAYQAATPLAAGNMHEFRIQTKRLRYRAEALAPDPTAGLVERALKRAQDAIGSWHDWLTLCGRADEATNGKDSSLTAALRARTDAALANALEVTARVAKRLQTMRVPARRKGIHPMTVVQPSAPKHGAGASA